MVWRGRLDEVTKPLLDDRFPDPPPAVTSPDSIASARAPSTKRLERTTAVRSPARSRRVASPIARRSSRRRCASGACAQEGHLRGSLRACELGAGHSNAVWI